MTAFDPAAAARLLAEAYNARSQVKEIPENARPRSLPEGYDVQDRVAAEASRSGGINDSVAGWKLGLGSRNAMKGAKLDRPVIGRVFKSRLYRPGDAVPVLAGVPVLVEIEIAFTLARDIAPGDHIANPLDAVGEAHIASELVVSRFKDRTTVGLPSFAADSVGFHALIVGQKIATSAIQSVTGTAVVMAGGKEMGRALSGDDSIDPVWSLGQLMAHARDRKITLRKGEIVTTGTMTKPFEILAPVVIEATSDGASITFSMS